MLPPTHHCPHLLNANFHHTVLLHTPPTAEARNMRSKILKRFPCSSTNASSYCTEVQQTNNACGSKVHGTFDGAAKGCSEHLIWDYINGSNVQIYELNLQFLKNSHQWNTNSISSVASNNWTLLVLINSAEYSNSLVYLNYYQFYMSVNVHCC